jgi:hypothetical protein
MADAAQGLGWWIAADGEWCPPDRSTRPLASGASERRSPSSAARLRQFGSQD